MKSKSVILIVAVTALAVIAGGIFYTINRSGTQSGSNKNTNSSSSPAKDPLSTVEPDTSSEEYKQFAVLKGDDYDRMFIPQMIDHHIAATDMANMAVKSAKHDELKTLAQNIITTQTDEIVNMTNWKQKWGYPENGGQPVVDHSKMSMNGGMSQGLVGKTGDDFDKAFLEQMLAHHQSAINMSATGKTNALHQETKDITVAITNAQTKEIIQMRKWQKEWGYK